MKEFGPENFEPSIDPGDEFKNNLRSKVIDAILAIEQSRSRRKLPNDTLHQELLESAEGCAERAWEAFTEGKFDQAQKEMALLESVIKEERESANKDSGLLEKYNALFQKDPQSRNELFQQEILSLQAKISKQALIYDFLEDLSQRYEEYTKEDQQILEARYWEEIDMVKKEGIKEAANRFQTTWTKIIKKILPNDPEV